ncbi:hypothetical protein [Leptospira wolffii]|uniref:hypothetical protein n=1 Tax=Leptospira wolffii TaxID=409998 RepID=UPI0002F11342|nr:hypothetical protein [Leptospira wolffii]EPG65830.1 hypothetical protein LEP1GSC061_2408 [Leptospira wolffii serovar Khorat str. Khorat-H2]
MRKFIIIILLISSSSYVFADAEKDRLKAEERQGFRLAIGIFALLGGISYGHHIYSQNSKQDYNHKVQYFALWIGSESYSSGNFSNLPASIYVYQDAASNVRHINRQIDTDIQQSVVLSTLGAMLLTNYFFQRAMDTNTSFRLNGSLAGASISISRSF